MNKQEYNVTVFIANVYKPIGTVNKTSWNQSFTTLRYISLHL